MRILIAVDMEGIAGVCVPEQVMPGAPRYAEACTYATADANACVAACFRAGATGVVVWDAHHRGHNLLWHDIDDRATLRQGGNDAGRLHDIGDFDGVILLGYHARAGTRSGVLEHTFSSRGWQDLWLNDRPAGEIAIDAAIAGDAGVPVLLVSGCDRACAEAAEWLPATRLAVVKTGLAMDGAELLPQERAHALIAERTEDALRHRDAIPPLRLEPPITLRLELVERGTLPRVEPEDPYRRLVDGRTIEVSADCVRAAFDRLH